MTRWQSNQRNASLLRYLASLTPSKRSLFWYAIKCITTDMYIHSIFHSNERCHQHHERRCCHKHLNKKKELFFTVAMAEFFFDRCNQTLWRVSELVMFLPVNADNYWEWVTRVASKWCAGEGWLSCWPLAGTAPIVAAFVNLQGGRRRHEPLKMAQADESL